MDWPYDDDNDYRVEDFEQLPDDDRDDTFYLDD